MYAAESCSVLRIRFFKKLEETVTRKPAKWNPETGHFAWSQKIRCKDPWNTFTCCYTGVKEKNGKTRGKGGGQFFEPF